MDLRKKIIVIGGGFAGLELIKRLGNSKKYDIIFLHH
jgi:NADH dehydrogenase